MQSSCCGLVNGLDCGDGGKVGGGIERIDIALALTGDGGGNGAVGAGFCQRFLAQLVKVATALGGAIAVLTGTIADGGTIPLPSGFSEAQCKFMVSMAEDDPRYNSWDIKENLPSKHYYFKCFTVGRVVTAKAYHGGADYMNDGWWLPGRANYLVIAYK